MEKEAFITTLSSALENRLGKRISEITYRKLGMSYTGLTLPDRVSAVFNVDKAYEEFLEGRSLPEICARAEAVLSMKSPITPSKMDVFKSFVNAKMRLFIRVSNRERNEEFLANVPHVNVLDLAITFHVYLAEDESSMNQFTVTNELMDAWKIDLNTLFREATISSSRLFPARLLKLSDIFGMELIDEGKSMVLTNLPTLNGAAALFYQDTIEELKKQFREGCYLVPTSIHEFIVFDRKSADAQVLIELLHRLNSNRNLVNEEDVLSDSIYYLDHSGLHRYIEA